MRKLLTPDMWCAHESMAVGQARLKDTGLKHIPTLAQIHPDHLRLAYEQLPPSSVRRLACPSWSLTAKICIWSALQPQPVLTSGSSAITVGLTGDCQLRQGRGQTGKRQCLLAGAGPGICSAGEGCVGLPLGAHRQLCVSDAGGARPPDPERPWRPHRARPRLLLLAR